MNNYKPIEVAIAISLYNFNVRPGIRAELLHEHFKGNCMEVADMMTILTNSPAFLATEFPYPTAKVYVDQALERYGEEAKERVGANEGFLEV